MKNIQNTPYVTVKDFLVSGESFDLLWDADREMLVTNPQPSAENLASYYESDAYISHTDSSKGLLSFLYQKVKKRSLRKKVNLIKRLYAGTGSLLDIGAGTGEFCKAAQAKNWMVFGAEPNEKARAFAQAKGIALKGSIDNFHGQQFDVVSMWHVLEHVPDLELSLQKIEALVKPGGTLLIAVPNFKSYDAKHYKSFWAAYDVPRHLWHFSKESMKHLFSENVELQEIKPMVFDSFYVSLLSEKYKKGNDFAIKAFFVGLWSNISAWNTKEYSSHIYCFKKTE